MKKFTLGVVAGMSSLALAVPILAQVSSAASSSSAATKAARQRPIPSQACVTAEAGLDDAFVANADTMNAAQKAAKQAHSIALKAAALIADDTQRQTAVKNANDALQTAMKAAMVTQSTQIKTATDAVRAACGAAMGMRESMMGDIKGFAGGKMTGPMHGRGGGMWNGKGPQKQTSSSTSSAQ